MRIAWATDLHLDAAERPDIDLWCVSVSQSGTTAVLVGGDISEAPELPDWLGFLDAKLRIPIYFVLGNHDYYRSDVAAVEDAVRRLDGTGLHYLPTVGRVQLSSDISLVGVGGWGDCQIGAVDDFEILTDYLAIRDLQETVDLEDVLDGFRERGALRNALRAFGIAAAETLRPSLVAAARTRGAVVVLTHVPPFREACWHRGAISDEKWLPGFTCKAVGDLLFSVAKHHTETTFTVLCGHTHGSGYVRMLPNLEVYTGFGDYGVLRFGVVEGRGKEIRVEPPTPSPRPN